MLRSAENVSGGRRRRVTEASPRPLSSLAGALGQPLQTLLTVRIAFRIRGATMLDRTTRVLYSPAAAKALEVALPRCDVGAAAVTGAREAVSQDPTSLDWGAGIAARRAAMIQSIRALL